MLPSDYPVEGGLTIIVPEHLRKEIREVYRKALKRNKKET